MLASSALALAARRPCWSLRSLCLCSVSPAAIAGHGRSHEPRRHFFLPFPAPSSRADCIARAYSSGPQRGRDHDHADQGPVSGRGARSSNERGEDVHGSYEYGDDSGRRPTWRRPMSFGNVGPSAYRQQRQQQQQQDFRRQGANAEDQGVRRAMPKNLGFLTNSAATMCSMRSRGFPFVEPPNPPMRFDSLGSVIDPALLRAIQRDFGYETCSDVQAALYAKMPLDKDLLVQAKTGTGKTLAFLLPTMNMVLDTIRRESSEAASNTTFENAQDKSSRDGEYTSGSEPTAGQREAPKPACRLLIVSPTRELALQIAAEATRLAQHARLNVVPLVGGASRRHQVSQLTGATPDVIIGTPGRLLDLFSESRTMREKLASVQALVLDEADRMLEIGFQKDIEALTALLPRQGVRKLLFSATYPADVNSLVKSTLRPGFEIVNTIAPGDVRTVAEVRQYYVVASLRDQLLHMHSIFYRGLRPDLAALVTRSNNRNDSPKQNENGPNKIDEAQLPPFKAIVFLPTTAAVDFYVRMMTLMHLPAVQPLHGKMTQSERSAASRRFRSAKRAVLVTTDVSARGVDYPDVNLVIQVGLATAREQYVHRIGRTARAGNSGEALLFLSPFESDFVNELKELPLKRMALATPDAAIELDCLKNCAGANHEEAGPEGSPSVISDEKMTAENASLRTLSLSKNLLEDCPLGRYDIELADWFRSTVLYYNGAGDFLKSSGKTAVQVLREIHAFLSEMGLVSMPRQPTSLSHDFTIAFQAINKNLAVESQGLRKLRR